MRSHDMAGSYFLLAGRFDESLPATSLSDHAVEAWHQRLRDYSVVVFTYRENPKFDCQ